MKKLLLTFLSFAFLQNVQAFEWGDQNPCACCCANWGQYFFIGPEIYHVHRFKKGGTKQSGTIYAGKLGYDRFKYNAFYWGGDLLYGEGHLHGKSQANNKLKSHFKDFIVEGRVGYNFGLNLGCCFSFSPFIGFGYGVERNNFVSPSPLKVHFKIWYTYIPVGFFTQFSYSPCFDVGLNFKAKFMIDGKNIVSHDEEFGKNTMLIKNKVHYRVELPLTYKYSSQFLISFVPFYEFRRFGGHINFPFDFIDTKLNIWGAGLRFIYSL